ncbi:MAG: sulfoacetaldehyde acetyltransferase [Nitriliruptorales bacterium]|nr:sulfoacetaldehyde acetyltransferase [Nitriliruptorales bacterium]
MGRMTPSEAMVETLRAEGVSVVPGIVGSAFMDALDLFPAAGIRFLPVRHEQSAAHMADAYARVTGGPAVCIGQNGPGITNMVTGVAAAYHAHSPVVVVTPSATTGSRGLDGFQEIEQLSVFRSITKYQVQVPRPDRMAETFRTAFRMAVASQGPVQVDVPRDFFYGECDDDILEPYQYRVQQRGEGDPAALDQAAELLAGAEFPMIVSGYGVVLADAHAETAELAELLTAPVANSYLHNDSFPATHPLAVGPVGYMGSKAAMQLMSKADVVLMLGNRINVFGTVPQYGLDFFPKAAKIIQIDIDPAQIGRAKSVEVGILGDAKEAARAIAERLRAKGLDDRRNQRRLNHITDVAQAWTAELREMSSSDATLINPRRALQELADLLPERAIVTTDVGNICSTANGYLRFTRPRTFLAAMGFGNCGFAYPAALGAKLARPDQPVVAIVGDGAWGMSLHETMTAVEEDLPVVAVVFNNQQWGAEKRNQMDFYANRFVGTDIGRDKQGFNFAAIAQAMGADAARIADPSDLKEGYASALNADRPTLLEIMVDPDILAEPFRRDALQQPVRHLDRYAHLNV